MRELRERFIDLVVAIQVDACAYGPEHAKSPDHYVDTIMALIPKPTVWLPCDKCRGAKCQTYRCASLEQYGDKNCIGCEDKVPCTCTDGKVEREIEMVTHHCDRIDKVRTLTLLDLLDADVAVAFGMLKTCNKSEFVETWPIPNNKGTLRIKREAK